MATRERLAQTSNMDENKYSINGHKRTPGSNEQYEVYKYSIMAARERLAQTSNMENRITQIFNKWPQENAWLKRAI